MMRNKISNFENVANVVHEIPFNGGTFKSVARVVTVTHTGGPCAAVHHHSPVKMVGCELLNEPRSKETNFFVTKLIISFPVVTRLTYSWRVTRGFRILLINSGNHLKNFLSADDSVLFESFNRFN